MTIDFAAKAAASRADFSIARSLSEDVASPPAADDSSDDGPRRRNGGKPYVSPLLRSRVGRGKPPEAQQLTEPAPVVEDATKPEPPPAISVSCSAITSSRKPPSQVTAATDNMQLACDTMGELMVAMRRVRQLRATLRACGVDITNAFILAAADEG